jgi:hypothetical protein
MTSLSRNAVTAAAGLAFAAVGWLTAIPLVQYVCLKRLRMLHPELFDGPAALRSIAQGIDDHQTAARADA